MALVAVTNVDVLNNVCEPRLLAVRAPASPHVLSLHPAHNRTLAPPASLRPTLHTPWDLLRSAAGAFYRGKSSVPLMCNVCARVGCVSSRKEHGRGGVCAWECGILRAGDRVHAM